jgi:hypothetical protein
MSYGLNVSHNEIALLEMATPTMRRRILARTGRRPRLQRAHLRRGMGRRSSFAAVVPAPEPPYDEEPD